jgi:acetylornithine deacetylase/succinyl-diaminopimelate desuccinylase-like protein
MNKEALLEELDGFLRIPSISAAAEHADDVRAAGEWVSSFLQRAGAESGLRETDTGLPLVDGLLRASTGAADAPTVLVYGHFDVQPAGERSLWESDPFVPEVRDGYLYARGAVDDKGNLYLLLRAAADLAASGELPVNLRVVCDGEEEIGGSSVVDFLEQENVHADACVIFDSMMPRLDTPSFEIGTRGLAYFRVAVRTGERDLHSGLFGGAALNAAHVLMDMLQAVADVPAELRAGVTPLTEGELRSWAELDGGEAMLAGQGGRARPELELADLYEAIVAHPAVDVNGISTGEAELVKTVLPVEARANVSLRLAPGQDTDEMVGAFERLLRGAAPAVADVSVECVNASAASRVDPDAPAIRLAREAFAEALGREPLLTRSGGTIPIMPALAARGIPTVLSGFGAPGHNMHSPNERLLVRYLPAGTDAARRMFTRFGELPRADS